MSASHQPKGAPYPKPRRSIPALLGWSFVGLMGVCSLMFIAIKRGEPISALWIMTAGLCALLLSYRFYSAWIASKVLALDTHRATPAHVHNDGRDFIPTNKWLVFGHHFAAIAGPGPLVGPVLAAQFGYLPGTLWIIVGATLAGAVHDAIVLFASVRRSGKSLGQMIRDEINPWVGMIAIVSTLTIMVILLAVLALVVVRALAESPWGLFTIGMTLPIAFLMGLALKIAPKQIGLISAFGVIGLMISVWGGHYVKEIPFLANLFTLDDKSLAITLMIYGLAASSLPMWMLLTPRDYLSTFMKLGTAVALGIAVLIVNPSLQMPAVTSFIDGSGPVVAGPVFPFVCITIACGAISGFHALISSGTTPKILDRECLVRMVGYGGMVVEMMVALMAIIAACALEPGVYFAINMRGGAEQVIAQINAFGFPVTTQQMHDLAVAVGETNLIGRTGGAPTFAVGMAHMFSQILSGPNAMALWYHFAVMFEALFILTTIDAGTRVGRFLLQDLLGHIWKPLGNTHDARTNLFASTLLVAAWGWFLWKGVVDPLGGINSLWPIFGIANQLLAVIGLSLATTVLIKMNKTRYAAITLIPLLFITWVTFHAGWLKIFSSDPRIGFLAGANKVLASGSSNAQTIASNFYLDAIITGIFLLLVTLILIGCTRQWIKIQTGRHPRTPKESPYIHRNK